MDEWSSGAVNTCAFMITRNPSNRRVVQDQHGRRSWNAFRKVSGAFLQAVGNVFSEPLSLTDVSLTPDQSDALIKYQRRLPHPTYLGEHAFLVAEIVDMESSSIKIHRALVKHGMISEAPIAPPGMLSPRHTTEDEHPVKTVGNNKEFPASTCIYWPFYGWAEISSCASLFLIEIAKRVGNRRGLSFFSVELNKVLRQKRLLWSEREENREVVGSLGTVAGPSGSERHGREESTTVDDQLPIATGGAARVMSSGGVDELPNYGELSAEGVADDDHEHEEMLTANATDELPSRVVDHLPSHQNS
ncbi:hypothetical protein EYC84_007705 [Monilinia fructicola]|uniref:Uncharacterized protein n=1 Tax=Monilinia fructicola TaxID=38448 RepID=A0A5M9JNX1_MONFR|nr:hypothetical protein EYC84_007705 [Monilinia fructicola]